ncbi:MAG: DUF2993 domain-containing protein [Leptolyngbyaceae cyanobacterium bins.302]|nr:DUF2993 domain-containing protein [Leptolyngbyaceae cyanobacterium bins.302]
MSLDDDAVNPVQAVDLELEEFIDATGNSQDSAQPTKQSRLISRVLTPAVRLWVRSQLEQVEDLHITIEASDRQLLGGGISQVSASASKAIYRGLHFSQVQVSGQQIQTNLGQMLRGKPFRLLAEFPVVGEVSLSEADLNASLTAPLLANAVADFLLTFLPQRQQSPTPTSTTATLRNVRVCLEADQLTLTAIVSTPETEQAIAVRTGLAVKNGNLLKLEGFQSCNSADELLPKHECTTKLTIPLGTDVYLEKLAIQANSLICQGQITVRPGE